MTELQLPVKRALRDEISERDVARMWNRIEARGRLRLRLRASRTWALAALAAAGAVVAVAIGWPSRDHGHRGPIALADGATWGTLRARGAERVLLDDGSTLALATGAVVEPLDNTETAVVVKQARGIVTYDIAPHHRRWTIECGAVSVEVIGTSFVVDRDDGRVRIDVMRGVVLVRGAGVPDHVVRLSAGMHIDVATEQRVVTASEPARAASAPPAPPAPPSRAGTASPSPAWHELAARGANDAAYATLGQGGVASAARSASVDELFALADVARLSGHAAEAVDPLRRIIDDHPHDARAPLAALALGRIQLRSLAMPGAAARTVARAIDLGVPADLAEDASALHVEALARAGKHAAARAEYARFIERFGVGPRTDELGRWIRND
jgi:transmembrane sensor